jgi:hypothetical protein
LKNPLGNEDILFCKASFYLNYIATATDKCILIWNYENLKLMGICYINDYIEIRDIYFLEPYPLLAIIDYYGSYIYLINIKYSEHLSTY